MSFMESSPVFQQHANPAVQPAQPVIHDAHARAPPPHLTKQPSVQYQAPSAPKFEHLSCLEPMKIKDLWSSGKSQVLSFLRHIQDFLHPRGLQMRQKRKKAETLEESLAWHWVVWKMKVKSQC
ncbi:hypothetical protein VP01_976g1 [Puccinia sorghi]|uniref:Uncharacterized protein n=1 Tax=Puccinia sorghi TaxID=27349 RepID=A0A0L6U7Y6_9BASI|nr:hypothetical protein VP01_976g1 [Puccinia sorghi]